MRAAKVVIFTLACLCLIGIQACEEKKETAATGDFVGWFLEHPTDSRDPNLLLCIARFETDVSAKSAYLEALRKTKQSDRRSCAAVTLAGFLHDNESARILKELLVDADDSIRLEACFALIRRHEEIDLETALKVLSCGPVPPASVSPDYADMETMLKASGGSVNGMTRAAVIQSLVATNDADPRGGVDPRVEQLYSKALADSSIGVRAALISRVPHRAGVRRMVKEWLRKQMSSAADAQRMGKGDIDACLVYLTDSYGLTWRKEWLYEPRSEISESWARTVLDLADQIDLFTDNLESKKFGEHP